MVGPVLWGKVEEQVVIRGIGRRRKQGRNTHSCSYLGTESNSMRSKPEFLMFCEAIP